MRDVNREHPGLVENGGVIAAAVALLALETLSLGADLRSPASGLVLIGVAGALVALGYLTGRWFALLVAAVLVAIPIAISQGFSDGVIESTRSCDPSCGISLVGFLMLVIPVAVSLTAMGVVARRVIRWPRSVGPR